MQKPEKVRAAVSVIVPAYNAEATISDCLKALRAAMGTDDELIVFDDGSTDATRDVAEAAGARIVSNSGAPRGPAHGRNTAATSATTPWLMFVDADVILHRDAIDLLAGALKGSGASAAFGSYDDQPRSLRTTSLYANLRHHFIHQNGQKQATTFWSGIGMIDKEAFLGAGGFDVAQFAFPSIEDVELGMRLIAARHRIILVPEAQGTHWKDWSLWRVWHTDVIRRALPWSRLIADGQVATSDLNLSHSERLLALLALAGPLFAVLGLYSRGALLLALAAALLYIWGNRRFFGFLASHLPFGKLLGAVAMHWCYHIYASATFASVLIATRVGLRSRAYNRAMPTTR